MGLFVTRTACTLVAGGSSLGRRRGGFKRTALGHSGHQCHHLTVRHRSYTAHSTTAVNTRKAIAIALLLPSRNVYPRALHYATRNTANSDQPCSRPTQTDPAPSKPRQPTALNTEAGLGAAQAITPVGLVAGGLISRLLATLGTTDFGLD